MYVERLGVDLSEKEVEIQEAIDESIGKLEEKFGIYIKVDYWEFKD